MIRALYTGYWKCLEGPVWACVPGLLLYKGFNRGYYKALIYGLPYGLSQFKAL